MIDALRFQTLNVHSVLKGLRRMAGEDLPRGLSPERIRVATMPCC